MISYQNGNNYFVYKTTRNIFDRKFKKVHLKLYLNMYRVQQYNMVILRIQFIENKNKIVAPNIINTYINIYHQHIYIYTSCIQYTIKNDRIMFYIIYSASMLSQQNKIFLVVSQKFLDLSHKNNNDSYSKKICQLVQFLDVQFCFLL